MIVNVADSFNETRTLNDTDQESIFFHRKVGLSSFFSRLYYCQRKSK